MKLKLQKDGQIFLFWKTMTSHENQARDKADLILNKTIEKYVNYRRGEGILILCGKWKLQKNFVFCGGHFELINTQFGYIN